MARIASFSAATWDSKYMAADILQAEQSIYVLSDTFTRKIWNTINQEINQIKKCLFFFPMYNLNNVQTIPMPKWLTYRT